MDAIKITRKIVVLFTLFTVLVMGTCFAEQNQVNQEHITAAEHLSNDYKDMRDMLRTGMTLKDFETLYNTAKLDKVRLMRDIEGDKNMVEVYVQVEDTQFLYDLIEDTWHQYAYSEVTDIKISDAIRHRYPELLKLHGDMWGDFDTEKVLHILFKYQGESIDKLDAAIASAKGTGANNQQ